MQADIRFSLLAGVLFLAVFMASPMLADPLAPDEISLRDNTVVAGLIVKSDPESVTIQTDRGEKRIPRDTILRIRQSDEAESYYTKVPAPGKLPDWRVIINDIRLEDDIRKFDQIPATAVTEGVFKNVPYRSFRINDFFELNIYGDPASPAGIEMGIYGIRRGIPLLQKRVRDFLASYLTEVPQLNAVYALSPKGETRKVGPMVIETTPPSAPDADGAWWLSIYNEKAIDDARLTDREYDLLTMPREEVLLPNGHVNPASWAKDELKEIRRRLSSERVLVRGFSRNRDGRFELHVSEQPAVTSVK